MQSHKQITGKQKGQKQMKEEDFKKLWNELTEDNKQIAFKKLLEYIQENERRKDDNRKEVNK